MSKEAKYEKKFSNRVKRTMFTDEMKKDYTILVPDMLPIHFKLIISVYESYGYHMELLTNRSREVVDEGLKNTHNDTCYPALLVMGQFMEALKSGRYDVNKVALLISQTGGGCRASNYIHLIRKAISTEFPQVPVLSLNFSGLEPDASIEMTLPIIIKLIHCVLYGDMLMTLYNQCKPYEINEGDTDKMLDRWQKRLGKLFSTSKDYTSTKRIYRAILKDFATIPRTKEKKPRVGIVGEIYVKYSPLANNDLNNFLISEDCEPNVPGLLDFILYFVRNCQNEKRIYDKNSALTPAYDIAYKIMHKAQRDQIEVMNEQGEFFPPHEFDNKIELADK